MNITRLALGLSLSMISLSFSAPALAGGILTDLRSAPSSEIGLCTVEHIYEGRCGCDWSNVTVDVVERPILTFERGAYDYEYVYTFHAGVCEFGFQFRTDTGVSGSWSVLSIDESPAWVTSEYEQLLTAMAFNWDNVPMLVEGIIDTIAAQLKAEQLEFCGEQDSTTNDPEDDFSVVFGRVGG